MSGMTALEDSFYNLFKNLKVNPLPEPQFQFHPSRKWAFDFAWPEYKVAVEIEGMNRNGKSRHRTVDGYTEDCTKYNEAAYDGWIVLRFTYRHLQARPVQIVELLKGVLRRREACKI